MFLLIGIGCLLLVYLIIKYDQYGWRGIFIGLGAITCFCLLFYLITKSLMSDIGFYIICSIIIIVAIIVIIGCTGLFHDIIFKRERAKRHKSEINGKEKPIHISENIEENQFRGRKNIYGIYIEDGVTEIGLGAFKDCIYLSYLRLPSSIKRVGGLQGCHIKTLEVSGYLDCNINLDRCSLSQSARKELFKHLKTMPIKKPFYYNPRYYFFRESKFHQERFDRFYRTRTIYCNPTYFKLTEEEKLLLAEKGWKVSESAPSQFLT